MVPPAFSLGQFSVGDLNDFVKDAIANLRQGEIVTLDLRRGEVHRGARSHNPDNSGAIV